MEKYMYFRKNQEIMGSKDKKFGPNPACHNVVIEAKKNAKKVSCHQCKQTMCF